MTTYECDQCGACCKGHLIVEAEELDLLREPKLASLAMKSYDQALYELQNDFGTAIILACGADRPCRFLAADNKCTIYPTRPNDCVAMQAGDQQCQEARYAQGLESLQPIVKSEFPLPPAR